MNNKTRLLYLLQYLQKHTDPDHIKNANDINAALSFLGKDLDRKTIYSDIESLNEAGYDVEMTRNGDKIGYYYDGNLFDMAELRILADSILSNDFLSRKKADAMLEKLLSLTNEYEAAELRQSLIYPSATAQNEQILYNIDAIQQAIRHRKAISFRYFDIDLSKKRVYRNHSYSVIPYALVLNNERYYLICYSERFENFGHYRLDKMDSISLEDTEHSFRQFDVNQYMSSAFGMYAGEKRSVTLRCRNSLAEMVTDRFGSNGIITRRDEQFFEIEAQVMLSPTFYSWIFSYNGDIRIIKPDDVIEEFRNQCENLLRGYRED